MLQCKLRRWHVLRKLRLLVAVNLSAQVTQTDVSLLAKCLCFHFGAQVTQTCTLLSFWCYVTEANMPDIMLYFAARYYAIREASIDKHLAFIWHFLHIHSREFIQTRCSIYLAFHAYYTTQNSHKSPGYQSYNTIQNSTNSNYNQNSYLFFLPGFHLHSVNLFHLFPLLIHLLDQSLQFCHNVHKFAALYTFLR